MNYQNIQIKLILVIALFNVFDAFGQITLKGQIINANTGYPEAFTSIILLNQSDTILKRTNLNGEFQFNIPNPNLYKIVIREYGYIPIDTTINLTSTSQLNFSLFKMHPDSLLLRFTNKKKALIDIKSNKIFLYLKGGKFSRESVKTSLDTTFENKFSLKYINRGCLHFKNDNDSEYNHTIFEYLDKTYGKVWRKSVRKDVVGL